MRFIFVGGVALKKEYNIPSILLSIDEPLSGLISICGEPFRSRTEMTNLSVSMVKTSSSVSLSIPTNLMFVLLSISIIIL